MTKSALWTLLAHQLIVKEANRFSNFWIAKITRKIRFLPYGAGPEFHTNLFHFQVIMILVKLKNIFYGRSLKSINILTLIAVGQIARNL